jgi:hypothetical protein
MDPSVIASLAVVTVTRAMMLTRRSATTAPPSPSLSDLVLDQIFTDLQGGGYRKLRFRPDGEAGDPAEGGEAGRRQTDQGGFACVYPKILRALPGRSIFTRAWLFMLILSQTILINVDN